MVRSQYHEIRDEHARLVDEKEWRKTWQNSKVIITHDDRKVIRARINVLIDELSFDDVA